MEDNFDFFLVSEEIEDKDNSKIECLFCGKEFLENNIGRHEKVCSKNPDNQKKHDIIDIFSKFNGKMEEILSLAAIGKKHILNEENLIQYFKEVEKVKLYELKRYFHDNSSYQIKIQLNNLQKRKVLFKGKNGWYGLRKK